VNRNKLFLNSSLQKAAEFRRRFAMARPFAFRTRRSSKSGGGFRRSRRILLPEPLQNPGFFKAEIACPVFLWRTEDDVIQELDLKHASAFGDSSRKPQVSLTWRRIARRMIVSKHKCAGGMADCGLKDLAWMSQAFVQSSFRDLANCYQAITCVK